MIPIVILAGGKSSRMGRDKSLLPFAGFDTLAQFQYERLKEAFDKVYISSKYDKFDFLPKERLILDKSDIFAPTIALLQSFQELKSEKIFFLSVDTPFVKVETIKELIDLDSKIAIAKSKYLETLCGIYHVSMVDKLKKMIDSDIHKMRYLLDGFDYKTLQRDEQEFLNLNKEEDYKRALELI